MQKFVAIGLGVSVPQIRDFDVLYRGRLVFNAILGSCNSLQLCNKRILTKNTSKDVVPAKDVPFGGADDDN